MALCAPEFEDDGACGSCWAACPSCFDSCQRLVCLALRSIGLEFLFQGHALSAGGRRVSARQPTYFLLQESRQRAGPCCPRPLRCATGQPAPSTSCGCAAKLAACLQHSAQTRCRKSEHDASALCGADASLKRPPSQAWAKGGNTGCGIASLCFLIAACVC